MRKRFAITLFSIIVLVASCMPLYVPPVPQSQAIQHPIRITEVTIEEGDTVRIRVSGKDEGWLDLQWFAVTGTVLQSASTWIQFDEPTILDVYVEHRSPNAAYLVLSMDDTVLRVVHLNE